MGWAYYEINGKPCGYSVEAMCEEPDCDRKIDRGLAFLCGAEPGGDEHGCGGYFCAEHLFLSVEDDTPQQCRRCAAPAPVAEDERTD